MLLCTERGRHSLGPQGPQGLKTSGQHRPRQLWPCRVTQGAPEAERTGASTPGLFSAAGHGEEVGQTKDAGVEVQRSMLENLCAGVEERMGASEEECTEATTGQAARE